jgi:hypothetical protein
LHLLIGELRPFTFRAVVGMYILTSPCFIIEFCLFTEFMFDFFSTSHLIILLMRSFPELLTWIYLYSSSVGSIPLGIFCNIGLVVINCFSLYLIWQVFISPLIQKDNFVNNGSLRWQLFCFRFEIYHSMLSCSLQGFCWEVCCYSDIFAFISNMIHLLWFSAFKLDFWIFFWHFNLFIIFRFIYWRVMDY